MPIDGESRAGNTQADRQTIALHAEDLSIARRRIAGDSVTVRVVTHETEQQIDEALHHERVEITRVPVGRIVDGLPPVREDGNLTVMSVVEEVIVVEHKLRLVEEIHIRRIQADDRHRETVMVRHQEAVITRTAPASQEVSGGMVTDTHSNPKT
ncbi:DUF2382 domain-containing protein [Lichenicoccus sp.]|uniref:DUF2382 domain-containing protein n=1 Tax=Lichenicoccus sp. TaxID=2781899 RepID=UPI003D0B152C